MKSEKIRRIHRHYENRVAPDRETYDILDWGSRESQIARFEILADAVGRRAPAQRGTLLDVGCGTADLAEFLRQRGIDLEYTGVDITHAVIAEALRRHPGTRLVEGDVFAAPPFKPQTFGVAYCSGVFNLRLGNNDEFVRRALPALFDCARHLAVANFLHRRTRKQYPHCQYYDPEAILDIARLLTPEVELIDGYLENDFTVVLVRN